MPVVYIKGAVNELDHLSSSINQGIDPPENFLQREIFQSPAYGGQAIGAIVGATSGRFDIRYPAIYPIQVFGNEG